jgi:AcrR family transcriptional regulator
VPLTLKDQLDATRRSHILRAAAEAFAERGYHATTIKEIARLAGVADGTIYNHFDNKEALLLGIFGQLQGELPAPALPRSLADTELRDLLRLLLRGALGGLEAHDFRLFRIVASEILVHPTLGARFRGEILAPMMAGAGDVLRSWSAARGTPLPHLDLTLRMVAALVLGLGMQRALCDDALAAAWERLPDDLAEVLVGGVASGASGRHHPDAAQQPDAGVRP